MKVNDRDREIYSELARRIAAACIAYQMGLAGVDHTLKRYRTIEIGDFWIEVAKYLAQRPDPLGLDDPAAAVRR